MPLLISPVVMFQAQNRETIVSTWKVAVSFKIIMTTSISRLFHSTTSDLQEQDHSVQDQDRFFLSQTGLVLRLMVFDHITIKYRVNTGILVVLIWLELCTY